MNSKRDFYPLILSGTRILINFRRLAVALMALLLTACTSSLWGGYGDDGLSKEEFTRYVENVFRKQNNLTSQAMMLMEGDADNNEYAPLLLAEQNMHKACRFLNEYASRDKDGLSIGLLLQRDVEKTAPDCEKTAKKLAALLANQQEQ